MTVTTNEYGQTNMWATEPRMYYDETEAERYGYETYAERAEKLNGRMAMLGFIALLGTELAMGGEAFTRGLLGIG